MAQPLVTVIGGTGFLGRYVVKELVEAGFRVQVIARNASRNRDLRPLSAKGQITLRDGDITRPKTIQSMLQGSYALVNLVGILYETRRQRFANIHAQCPERLAKMAKEEGVKRFIQISAIGVDRAMQSVYARTKSTGEKAVLAAFPEATIIRPSIVFGQEDNFFNQFACMSRFLPALPLIGGGHTKFQPVYVGDIAKFVTAALESNTTKGRIYELGGPDVMSFSQILKFILSHTRRKRILMPLPWALASFIGAFGQLLPVPPITRDQVRLLKYDNIVKAELDGFTLLGMTPRPVDLVVPAYLQRYAVYGTKDAASGAATA